ncbi:hypothetical protein SDC9_199653 [bioreactor metagenome]|uniref:Uncharacterized protein n=1 Tax=bioreactor metagenome TaxID=1076179 RepID=A0A645IL36_9ZZZZ
MPVCDQDRIVGCDDTFEQVALPDEGRTVEIGWMTVDIPRCGYLHDLAMVHDGNPVGDGQCFVLIMGHIDGGDAEFFLDLTNSRTHLDAQFGIEVR